MSRAINVNAPQDHVVATCAKKKLGISAIETLHSGGTRVVMNNAVDAAEVVKFYKTKVIAGPVTRTPTRLSRF